MNESELYSILTRYGDSYELNIKGNTGKLLENLEQFLKTKNKSSPACRHRHDISFLNIKRMAIEKKSYLKQKLHL